jgi:hypothetical protein
MFIQRTAAILAAVTGGVGVFCVAYSSASAEVAATPDSPAGSYPIMQGTLAATSNYSITFINGTLMVLPTLNFGASPMKSLAPVPATLTPETGLTAAGLPRRVRLARLGLCRSRGATPA